MMGLNRTHRSILRGCHGSFERAPVSAVAEGWRWSGHGGSDVVHGPEELIGKRGAVCRLWSPQLCV